MLQALSSNDAAAALHRAPGVLSQVHAALVHRASHAYQSGGAAAAKDLFAAALQYSRPEARPQAARALAACTSALGQHQRAAEWCGIAERGQSQPSSLTLLLRLQALAHTGDAPQAVAAIRRLTSGACPDFHTSLLPAMCQAAAKAAHPCVSKEALGAAVRALIQPDAATSALPAGQEAALLLAHTQAIAACLEAAEGTAAATAAPLYGELVASVKLATRRLRALGWKTLAAGGQVWTAGQGVRWCREAWPDHARTAHNSLP